jgi:predicted ArsR family transcriptional regulator
MNEQYLTVAEVAKMLDVSKDTVRRMFTEEPGVIDVGAQRRRASRPYRILRIPRSVLERVLAGRAVKGNTRPRNDDDLKLSE